MGIRDLEWEKLLVENSEGGILKQKISKHLLDMVKAAYDLGWHDCAQQNKGSTEQQSDNSKSAPCRVCGSKFTKQVTVDECESCGALK